MTPEQFTYWLQGFMEILDPSMIYEKETKIIKDHLNLVFKKEIPDYSKFKDSTFNPIHPNFNTNFLYKPKQTIC